MLSSITFRALSIHGRRNLDFLMAEHSAHAGRENGNLAAPYKQLAVWGATAADVRTGFDEVCATGLVRLTKQGLRQGGGGEPSLYALTWMPTRAAGGVMAPPTHDWIKVLNDLGKLGIRDVRQTRAWLKLQRGASSRAVRRLTPRLHVGSPIIHEARNTP